jgi:ribosomal-protein-serine acetyltransferase
MTKSCRAVINYIFNELELNRVEIRAAVLNKKSRAIPERLGFTQEGIIRSAEWLYDHFVDHVVYGMLRDEWSNS